MAGSVKTEREDRHPKRAEKSNLPIPCSQTPRLQKRQITDFCSLDSQSVVPYSESHSSDNQINTDALLSVVKGSLKW